MLRKITAAGACGVSLIASAGQAQTCQMEGADVFDGFNDADISQLIDLPDPDTLRATMPLELPLVNRTISGDIGGFTKSWCKIGIQEMIVEITFDVEDDAVAAVEQRALYVWDATGDPIGWRIEALGERFKCVRGDDPYAATCP